MRMNSVTASRYAVQCDRAGLSHSDAETLRRAALVLHRISEEECNGTLYRAEGVKEGETYINLGGKQFPFVEDAVYRVGNINGPGPLRYWRTADRETGARRRIEAVAARIGATVSYQGDPRGWPVELRLADGRTINPPPCSR